jgi:hypothetical protein
LRVITAFSPIVLAWLKTGRSSSPEPTRPLDHGRGRVTWIGRHLRHFDPPAADRDDVRERATDVDAQH